MTQPITTIAELLAFWDSDEGKPYKGNLIDLDAYRAGGGLSCMCAQGQALHAFAKVTPSRLGRMYPKTSDKLTAETLGISRFQAALLRQINDGREGAPSIVLVDPAAVLGDQWSRLLDFGWAMDRIDHTGWSKISTAWDAAGAAARGAAWDAARAAAAGGAAGAAARGAAGAAAAVWDLARAAAVAANEIQGAATLRERGQPFTALPLFGFANPEAIPLRPRDYGQRQGPLPILMGAGE